MSASSRCRRSTRWMILCSLAISLSLCGLACSDDEGEQADETPVLDAGGGGREDAGETGQDAGPSDAGAQPDAGPGDRDSGVVEEDGAKLARLAGPSLLAPGAAATMSVWIEAAVDEAVQVALTVGSGASLSARSVEIAAGARSADVTVTAGGDARAQVVLTATLDGEEVTHTFAVVAEAAAPTSIALAAAPATLVKGGSSLITVALDAPAQAEVRVALSADCGSLESAVGVAVGVNAALTEFDARGCSSERATITASAEGLTSDELALPLAAQGGRLVINQVMTRTNNASAEFVELFNGTAAAIDLSPFVLWYGGADEARPGINLKTTRGLDFSGRAIAPGGFFLVTFKDALRAFEGVTADIALKVEGGFNDEIGGSLWLTNSTEVPEMGSAALIDLVGWGSAQSYEGHAAALSPAEANSAIKRVPDGEDSGDNAEDFHLLDRATPRSSASR